MNWGAVLIRAWLRKEHIRMLGSPRTQGMEEALPWASRVLRDYLRKEAKELQVFGKENILMPAETLHSVKFGLLPGASSFARIIQHRLHWGSRGRNLRRKGWCVFSSGQEALLRMCIACHSNHGHSSSCIYKDPRVPRRLTRTRRSVLRPECLQVPL